MIIRSMFFAAVFAFVQANERSVPIRLRNAAIQLSDQRLADMTVLAGARPWLVMEGPRLALDLYLPPATRSVEFRRGTFVRFTAQQQSTFGYAQVAIPGRVFDDVTSNKDVNRPFEVRGTISDADILGAVKVARELKLVDIANNKLAVVGVERSTVTDEYCSVHLGVGGEYVRLGLQRQGNTWRIISRAVA